MITNVNLMYGPGCNIRKMESTIVTTIIDTLRLGECVTIFTNMLIISLLVESPNKVCASSYPHISPSCYNSTLTCLNGGNLSFPGMPPYSSNYSKLIRYGYGPNIRTSEYPIDEKVYNVLSLFYKNEEDIRVFLSLRKDSNGTWEKGLIGVPELKTVQEDERKYVFCDKVYSTFYCSPYTKNCDNGKRNLNELPYVDSIFTEHVVEIVFHGSPTLKIEVKILLYNPVTLEHRIVTIPLFTPALLDATFNILYRTLYRDPTSHALLKTFKNFFDQNIEEPYRGPKNDRFVRVWQKDGFARVGGPTL
uniref:Envelope glycoprotein L n=1 Tax=Elephant endotheliotropic herpesvirus 1A TaxID=759753 RepID=U5U3K5_ELHV1|nr:envelope glycoprotein L [Elephant endotheliotropic herpesvirus 1A]AID07156.1 envelope glycoprotein L [Elephant endotheliotropic herpesvirus 1A]